MAFTSSLYWKTTKILCSYWSMASRRGWLTDSCRHFTHIYHVYCIGKIKKYTYVCVDAHVLLYFGVNGKFTRQPALWLPNPHSTPALVNLKALLEHTMTSCPLNAHLCSSPVSNGRVTGRFVLWQIYSSWLPYRALGKWDTNATLSAVSQPWNHSCSH